MQLSPYRDVLSLAAVRSVLVLGFLVRMPMFATTIVLTVHVVSTLGRSYGEAGLVSAAFTIALAVSAPWRGRLLDRHGLRRVVAPSIAVTLCVWTALPFLPYAVLLPASVVGGLFAVPSFSILRQALIAAVPDDRRRTTLSLDSVFTELSFMIGPAAAIWAATSLDTRVVLVVLALLSVLAAVSVWVVNPALHAAVPADGLGAGAALGVDPAGAAEGAAYPVVEVFAPGDTAYPDGDADADANAVADAAADVLAGEPSRRWVSLGVVAVLLAASATTVVLSGTDVSIVASLRAIGQASAIGWVLSLWGLGSLLGGLVYGAWHRSISVFWLLGGLAASTLPVAFAGSLFWLAVLLFLCGVLCAPTITATVDHLSRLVPEQFRGEAMGWHGSAMTAGSAFGAPLAGFAVDHGGWPWGYASVSLVGVAVALAGGLAVQVRRARRPAYG